MLDKCIKYDIITIEKREEIEKMNRLDIIWEAIIQNGIATNDEIDLVTSIYGYTEEVLNDIIYVRTGLHTIEQVFEEMD